MCAVWGHNSLCEHGPWTLTYDLHLNVPKGGGGIMGADYWGEIYPAVDLFVLEIMPRTAIDR